MEMRDYVKIILKRLWLIVLGGVVFAALGYVVYWLLGFSYTAVATVSIGQDVSVYEPDLETSKMGEDLLLTYADLSTRTPVLQDVIDQLDLNTTPDELEPAITAEIVEGTQWLEIQVTETDPVMAANIANAVANQLIAVTTARLRNFVTIVEPASVPTKPSISPWLVAALVGTAGILLVAGLVFLAEFLRDPVYSPEELAERANLPVLTVVRKEARGIRQAVRLPAWQRTNEAMWWPLVQLCRHRYEEYIVPSQAKEGQLRVLVTNPDGGHDKAVVATNLAAAWARSGAEVILLDADINAPILDRWLQVSPEYGLSELIGEDYDKSKLREALQPTGIPSVSVLPAGSRKEALNGTFRPQMFQTLLDELTDMADVIIVNGPPLLTSPEGTMMAGQAHGILLTLQAGRTRMATASEARDVLEMMRGDLWGAILTEGIG